MGTKNTDMTREEVFIKDLEGYLDIKLDRYSVNKIMGFLGTYKASLPVPEPKIITREKIVFKNIYVDGEIKDDNSIINFTPADIIKIVSEITGLSISDIKGLRRDADLILARHVSIYTIKNFFNSSSLESIGKMFNRRHHTTIIYACSHTRKMLDVGDNNYSQLIDELNKKLLIFGELKKTG